MANPKEITLGILPSLGGSLESQKKDKREGLFLNYYIPTYLKHFDRITYFSYANEALRNIPKFEIVGNKLNLHRYIYGLLLPFFHFKTIRKCSVLRCMHLNGALTALIAKWFFGIRFVTTYGYDYVRFAEIEKHFIQARLLKLVIPLVLKAADGVIVTTDELRKRVEMYIGRSMKIKKIPNGVDCDRFHPSKQSGNNPRTTFQMLAIGRLERQKNLFFLLDVISEVAKKRPVRLTLIGNGNLRGELHEKAFKDKVPVNFVESVPYEFMPEAHKEADCYISTSLSEGHPKSLIEAMSSGLPCIVSDCPGNRTMIENGKSGIVLDASDVRKWVDSIVYLIDHAEEQSKFGAAARQYIKESFDLRSTLDMDLEFVVSAANNSVKKDNNLLTPNLETL